MVQPDYYISEFFLMLEKKIAEWADCLGKHTYLGDTDLRNPLESFVNYAYYPIRNEYCRLRCDGMSPQSALSLLVKLPLPKNTPKGIHTLLTKQNIISKWNDILSPLKGRPVFYAHISRMIEYLLPFIKNRTGNSTLVTECRPNIESIKSVGNITLVRFVDSGCRLFVNDFLEYNFPLFHSFSNTIALLDRCLEPPVFYSVCGCQTQAKIWASICNSRGGESVLFQHGWPAHIHAGFANMPYKKMVLWGKRFKDLWHHRNPLIEYSVGGYPYPVLKTGDHNCITFFLQEPYFVSSTDILNRYYNLIIDTARRNPGLSILYRLHPESDIDSEIRDRLDSGINTYDVSDKPLEDVYSRTKVAVSHYSSTIMECIVHGCIPLVFNPTPNWQYTPDLEAESIGYISTSEHEFRTKLPFALNTDIPEHKIAEWYEPASG